MTKFIVNNRTDALKTDINLFFTITNCRISRSRSLADASHEFQIHVSVLILTIKINQWARLNFCSYRKKVIRIFSAQPVKTPYFNTSLTRKQARWPISWMVITSSFKKSLIVEQIQGNYLKRNDVSYYSIAKTNNSLYCIHSWRETAKVSLLLEP